MKNGSGTIVGIFTALLTLAAIAVIVSQRAQTSSILNALGSAAAVSINAATAPVTGASNGSVGK
jgi:hypothetical protein